MTRASPKRKAANATAPAAAKAPPTRVASAQRKAAMRAQSGVTRKPHPPSAEPEVYPIGRGRKALKGISIYMHPLAKDVLDRIAQQQKRTVQELGLEALNLLFAHYGEKPIA